MRSNSRNGGARQHDHQLTLIGETHRVWLEWPKFSTDLGYRKLSRDDIAQFATNFYLLAANLAMNLSYMACACPASQESTERARRVRLHRMVQSRMMDACKNRDNEPVYTALNFYRARVGQLEVSRDGRLERVRLSRSGWLAAVPRARA